VSQIGDEYHRALQRVHASLILKESTLRKRSTWGTHPPAPPPGSPNGSFLTVTWIALYIKNMDVDLLHLFIYLFYKIPQCHLFIYFSKILPMPFIYLFSKILPMPFIYLYLYFHFKKKSQWPSIYLISYSL